jgi:acetoacetate decarboxylase
MLYNQLRTHRWTRIRGAIVHPTARRPVRRSADPWRDSSWIWPDIVFGRDNREADLAKVKATLNEPNFLLKIIPHVDGSPRICELVQYRLEDIVLKGAWTGPAALALTPHALAPVAELPVLEIVSAVHIRADLTLGLGTVVHDYLQQPARGSIRTGEKALVF